MTASLFSFFTGDGNANQENINEKITRNIASSSAKRALITSDCQINGSLRLSLGSVQKVARQAEELNLDWSAIEKLNSKPEFLSVRSCSYFFIFNHPLKSRI